MSTRQSHAIKQSRRHTAFQLRLKASVPILAVGLGLIGVTDSVWADCSNTIIGTLVSGQTNSLTYCDFSISGTGIINGGTGTGVNNSGTIGALTNSGRIWGGSTGGAIVNSGTIGALTNSGTIAGGSYGI